MMYFKVDYRKNDKAVRFLIRRWCTEVGASCVDLLLDGRYVFNGEIV